MKLIAEMHRQCRIKEFGSRDDAVDFARKNWRRIHQCDVNRLFMVDDDHCEENLWPPTPYHEIPVGYYGCDGKRYHLDRPTTGCWAGWTFLTTGSDYHDRKTIASVRPDGSVCKPHQVLVRIAADPFARSTEYGHITGTCGVCGRKLENPDSRRLGIGPVCRQKFGG